MKLPVQRGLDEHEGRYHIRTDKRKPKRDQRLT
jgi:hypothetical protein